MTQFLGPFTLWIFIFDLCEPETEIEVYGILISFGIRYIQNWVSHPLCDLANILSLLFSGIESTSDNYSPGDWRAETGQHVL